MVISLIINFCFLGYGLFNYINAESNIPLYMQYDIHLLNFKAIDLEIQSYEGSLMQIQDGDNIIKFPSRWYEGLKDFRIINCKEDKLVGKEVKFCKDDDKKTNVMGRYHGGDLNLILIDENLEKHLFEITVIHEIGHHVWYIHLNKSFRKKWCDNYKSQEDYITGYAYEDCSEDFAEAFAIYYLEGKVMKHEKELIEEVFRLTTS